MRGLSGWLTPIGRTAYVPAELARAVDRDEQVAKAITWARKSRVAVPVAGVGAHQHARILAVL
jgi:hypothetical protein